MQRIEPMSVLIYETLLPSVECREGLDPMTTNLVVANPKGQIKTICLAVSTAMKKKLGVRSCRVLKYPKELKYIMAPPRMQPLY